MRFSMIITSVLLVTALTITGCSNKPDDFPKVFPTSVTVTKDGNPAPNLIVQLSRPGELAYVIQGQTDKAGVAQLSTNCNVYAEKGAPAGKFYVTFQAITDEIGSVSVEEFQKMDQAARDAHKAETDKASAEALANNPVPSSLRNANDKTLEVEIPDGGTSLTVELSEYPHDPSRDQMMLMIQK